VGLHGIAFDQPFGDKGIPELAFVMFEGKFAIITPALVSGAIAERVRFQAFVLFTFLWATLVSCPLAHWVWSPDGWLCKVGVLDFAGGTVVHISAGVSALVLALLVGPRRDSVPEQASVVPHNLPFPLLGAGLLWFGSFGFNAGSAVGLPGSVAITPAAGFVTPLSALGIDLGSGVVCCVAVDWKARLR
jgi:Amt family ammonium transporter